ncbi:MAG TPA: AbrB/MazE/SpoVT family DNA-binding domain-containing protein [Planctomycetota bacterium]|nr:AbrB/MazE/SpoVT family DNA-binding domain-containing protein [Planctomycetota bacterium]
MYLEVDKFGRVVIPKKLRERFGFTPGSRLKVKASRRGGIFLRREKQSADVIEKDGFLILSKKGMGRQVRDGAEEVREERIRQILGDE